MSIETTCTDVLSAYRDLCFPEGIVRPETHYQLHTDSHPPILDITLGFPGDHYRKQLSEALSQAFAKTKLDGLNIHIQSHIKPHAIQTGLQGLAGVKNCIAVASGKGGVGKSTTAINLALALSQEGARVGLLDADIYGPNQPQMLGTHEKPSSLDGKKMQPIMAHGLQTMSIGYLVDAKTPMVWRGPMVSGALQQLLQDTAWEDLDYLIIDLPPGTGDVQLTLAQRIPMSGAVMVTTPQDIALADVKKAIAMFQKVNIPILGIIENMSLYKCSHCGHEEAIFGEGGGKALALAYETELLGQLPLDSRIRSQADNGNPIVIADPTHPASLIYKDIALTMSSRLARRKSDLSRKFPRIEIRNQ